MYHGNLMTQVERNVLMDLFPTRFIRLICLRMLIPGCMAVAGWVSLCQGAAIDNWSNTDMAVDVAIDADNGVLWTVSTGGVVRWNLSENTCEKFTAGNGLRDNWCLCGAVSNDGSFWLGTLGGGLARHRFGEWRHWTKDDDGLPYDEIRCLDVDPQNRLWAAFGAAFGNGIGIREGTIWTYITVADGLSHNRVNAIETNTQGAWIGTIEGLDRIREGAEGIEVAGSYTTADGLPDDHILSVAADRNGGCWAGTASGLAHLSIHGVAVYHTSDGLPDDRIQALHVDDGGVLYAGTPRGVAVFNGAGFQPVDSLAGADVREMDSTGGDMYFAVFRRGIEMFRNGLPYRRYATDDPLPGNDVRAVACHDGRVWFGTVRQGVGWFDGETRWIDDSGCGIDTAEVRHVVVDQNGVKWFSTFDRGVFALDGDEWTRYSAPGSLPCDAVVSGYVDPDNVKWFATWGGGIARFDGGTWSVIDTSDGLPTNLTYNVDRDRRGNYWFTLDTGVVSYRDGEILEYFTEADGLVFHRVYDVAVDTRNTVWFGACKGMSRFADGVFTNYYAGDDALAHYRVRDITFDPFGDLWIATGAGVNRFDGETFTTFAPSDGLAGYETYCVSRDDLGNLWFGSEGGLTRVRPEPPPCTDTGAAVIMPSHTYFPGDNCRLDVLICNMSGTSMVDCRLYAAIEVAGTYYFGPLFTTVPDMYGLPTLPPGETMVEIIPDFPWPAGCGAMDRVICYAVVTSSDGSIVIGDLGSWAFGWREDP